MAATLLSAVLMAGIVGPALETFLVATQKANGAWEPNYTLVLDKDPLVATSRRGRDYTIGAVVVGEPDAPGVPLLADRPLLVDQALLAPALADPGSPDGARESAVPPGSSREHLAAGIANLCLPAVDSEALLYVLDWRVGLALTCFVATSTMATSRPARRCPSATAANNASSVVLNRSYDIASATRSSIVRKVNSGVPGASSAIVFRTAGMIAFGSPAVRMNSVSRPYGDWLYER